MGTPNYTDPFPEEWGNLRQLINAAMTAAWSRIAYMRLVARELVVGAVTGRRIVFNPDDAPLPEIRLYRGDGDAYASIIAGGIEGAGIEITGTADGAGSRYSLLMDEENFKVFFRDPAGVRAEGAMLQATSSDAAVGFLGADSSEENYWYQDANHTTLIGRWADGDAGPYWGIITGSGSVSGTSATVTYPFPMATAVHPHVSLEAAAAQGSGLTAASTTGFTFRWVTSGSVTLRWWVWRG